MADYRFGGTSQPQSFPPYYVARPGAPRVYQDPYANGQAGRGKSEMITPQMLAQRRARSLRTPQQEEAAGVLADKIEQIMSDPNPAREPLTPMQASRLQLAQKNAAVFKSMWQPSAMQDSLNKQYASAMKIGMPAQPEVAGGPPSIFPQQGPNTRYVGRVDLPSQDKSGVNGLGFTQSGQAYVPRDGGGIESSRFVEGVDRTLRDGSVMKVTRNPETGGIMLQGGGRPLTPQQMQYLAQKRAAMAQAYKDTRALRAFDRNPQLADAAPVIGALGRLPVRKQDGTLASTGSPATAVPQPGPKASGIGDEPAVKYGYDAVADAANRALTDNPYWEGAKEMIAPVAGAGVAATLGAALLPGGRRMIGNFAGGMRNFVSPLFGTSTPTQSAAPGAGTQVPPVQSNPWTTATQTRAPSQPVQQASSAWQRGFNSAQSTGPSPWAQMQAGDATVSQPAVQGVAQPKPAGVVPNSIPTFSTLDEAIAAARAQQPTQTPQPGSVASQINPLTGQPFGTGNVPLPPAPTQTPQPAAAPVSQPVVQPTQPAVATPSPQVATPAVAQPATTQQAATPAKKGRGKAASKTASAVPPSSAVMNQPAAVKAGIGAAAQPAPVAPTPSPSAVAAAAPAPVAPAPAQSPSPAATAQPAATPAAKPTAVIPPTSTKDAEKILEVMMKNPGMSMDDARQIALGNPASTAPSAKAVASTKAAKAMTAAKQAPAPAAAPAQAPQPVSQPKAWRLMEDAIADFKAANGGRNPTMGEMDQIENEVARYNAAVDGVETPPPESAVAKPKASSKSKKGAVGVVASNPVPVEVLPDKGMQVKPTKAQSKTATVESQLSNLSKFTTPQQQVEAVMANNPQSAKQFALQYKKIFGVDKPIGVEFPGAIDTPVQAKVASPKTSKLRAVLPGGNALMFGAQMALPYALRMLPGGGALPQQDNATPSTYRGQLAANLGRVGREAYKEIGGNAGLPLTQSEATVEMYRRMGDQMSGMHPTDRNLYRSIVNSPAIRLQGGLSATDKQQLDRILEQYRPPSQLRRKLIPSIPVGVNPGF